MIKIHCVGAILPPIMHPISKANCDFDTRSSSELWSEVLQVHVLHGNRNREEGKSNHMTGDCYVDSFSNALAVLCLPNVFTLWRNQTRSFRDITRKSKALGLIERHHWHQSSNSCGLYFNNLFQCLHTGASTEEIYTLCNLLTHVSVPTWFPNRLNPLMASRAALARPTELQG